MVQLTGRLLMNKSEYSVTDIFPSWKLQFGMMNRRSRIKRSVYKNQNIHPWPIYQVLFTCLVRACCTRQAGNYWCSFNSFASKRKSRLGLHSHSISF